jgi:hypothetical protein
MLLGFKRRFAPMIQRGEKTHTIRGYRKIPPRIGEICHCYVDPRRKTMRLLGRWPCVKLQQISISEDAQIRIDGLPIEGDEKELLARRDGFSSFEEMLRFWEGRLPFKGQIIHWQFSRSTGKGVFGQEKVRTFE